jgi:hypothetical protein
MKKLLGIIIIGMLWCSSVLASEDKYWKIDNDYLTPQCFVYEYISGDNFKEFYNRYSPAIMKAYGDEDRDKKQKIFIFNERIGSFFPKYIPIGEEFKASWGDTLSLTTYLKDCAKSTHTKIDKSKDYYQLVDDDKVEFNTAKWSFKNKCLVYASDLISISKAKCLDIKTVAYTEVFTGGTMQPITQYNTYGIYEIDGEKIILPLQFNAELVKEKENIKNVSYDWFKTHSKSLTANQLIDEKVYDFLKNNISSKKLYLGMSRGKKEEPLINSFMKVMGGSPDDVIYIDDNRYIFTSACRHQSCGEKGVLFIDTQEKLTIGLIRHFFMGEVREHDDGAFLIFSKKHKSFEEVPKIFIKMVKEWVGTSNNNNPPGVVRFIGIDGEIIDVTAKYKLY